MNFGFTGRILHIDLTHRRVETEEQDISFYRNYLGGRGIGYHYLMKKLPPRVEPKSNPKTLPTGSGKPPNSASPLACSCNTASIRPSSVKVALS